MVSYQQKQFQLFEKIEEKFKKGENPSTIVESLSDYASDSRICLTSVVFPPREIQQAIISKVIKPLKNADNRLYYYLPNSFHLTIQNIKSIANPPNFTNEEIEKVKKVLQSVVPRYKSFEFNIKGIFELPTSLSLRAYSDEILKYLVLELREELKNVGVYDNKKYASSEIFFGNISICRFTETPNNSFFEEEKKLKDVRIGKLKVAKISLITTNSVCHPGKTNIIEEFNLHL
ncbi:MAG: hypothetical protein HYT83_03425 [Candidatus Levybacteria bacterium]|nr:hypothetical protein [Candidatus Levybacteria bacterium]